MTIDLQRRSSLLGVSLKETIEPLLEKARSERLQEIVEKFGNRERLAGVAVYDVKDKLIARTPPLADHLSVTPKFVTNVMNFNLEGGHFFHLGFCRSIGKRLWQVPWSFPWCPSFLIDWSITGPIAKIAEWMKQLRLEKNKEAARSTGITQRQEFLGA